MIIIYQLISDMFRIFSNQYTSATGKRLLHYKKIHLTLVRQRKTLSKLLSISLQLLCICCYFCMLVILNALHIGSLNVNDSEVMFHLLHIFLDQIYINSQSSIVHLLFRIILFCNEFPYLLALCNFSTLLIIGSFSTIPFYYYEIYVNN